jgi:hypothetical protein
LVNSGESQRKNSNGIWRAKPMNKAKSRIVGIFEGKRLVPTLGEKQVVKKAITGFGKYKEENLKTIGE